MIHKLLGHGNPLSIIVRLFTTLIPALQFTIDAGKFNISNSHLSIELVQLSSLSSHLKDKLRILLLNHVSLMNPVTVNCKASQGDSNFFPSKQ